MSEKKWKDYLLKSGLPLENDIKNILDSKGCISNFDYSYRRISEDNTIKEFSFDIDSSYIKANHFFNLMVECKYRDPSTSWIFIPGEFHGFSGLGYTSFLHPCDHFNQMNKIEKYEINRQPIGKACEKGIEILSSGNNSKSITQAIHQLSYAMAERYTDTMRHQVERLLGKEEIIHYNIPIIVTTASLFRLIEEKTIDDIKKAERIQDVATKEEYLVLDINTSKDLEEYNKAIFKDFIECYGMEELNKLLNSFDDDIKNVCHVISSHYAPKAILIVHHKQNNETLGKLFELMDYIVNKIHLL